MTITEISSLYWGRTDRFVEDVHDLWMKAARDDDCNHAMSSATVIQHTFPVRTQHFNMLFDPVVHNWVKCCQMMPDIQHLIRAMSSMVQTDESSRLAVK